MTEPTANRRVVEAFVEAINAQDWDSLASIIAPGFVRHSYAAGAPGVRGRADFFQYLRSEYETFPDARETIEDILVDGHRVAVRHRFTGTQAGRRGSYPPSGKSMTRVFRPRAQKSTLVACFAWASTLTEGS